MVNATYECCKQLNLSFEIARNIQYKGRVYKQPKKDYA